MRRCNFTVKEGKKVYRIGIDLGGTNIAGGVVDEKGQIILKKEIKTKKERPIEEIMDDMVFLIKKLERESGKYIEAVGIGCPGSIDSKRGTVIYSNNIPMKNVEMAEYIESRIKKPVSIENDANAAALGEYCVSGGDDSFILVTLGTGVGGGAVLNKKIYKGFNGCGIEPGHMTIMSGGKKCTCGKSGCWEAYASVTALIEMTKAAAEENPESMMNESGIIDGRTAFDAAKKGDEKAKKVVEEYERYVAEGIVSLINIFEPQKLCIGGGISREGEYLLEPIRRYVSEYEFNKYGEKTEITAAKLFNDAGIIGAAMAAREKKFFKMCPVFKDYIWGGTRLTKELKKNSPFEKTAESWEASVNKNGESCLEDGTSLSEYIKAHPGCLGKGVDEFPVLIKLIDAEDNLSVQVHPNDEYARTQEKSLGKSEMWYVTDCGEGAFLYFGFKKDTNREEVKKSIEEGTLTDMLNKVPVSPGDVFYIPAGTVHAIGKGILIMEIQQNSDVTYRVFDYWRGRKLDVDKALDVMKYEKTETRGQKMPVKCRYFTVEKHETDRKREIELRKDTFCIMTVTKGSAEVKIGEQTESVESGETIFIPAQNEVMTIEGKCDIIIVTKGEIEND